jgi:2-oxoglutarate ferredoxin oxidoreductase subunit beta
MKTKSTPLGNLEWPINPLTSAIMNGATYVARSFSGDPKHLTELMKGGIRHKGFALIDVFSPCVTFNNDNDYPFFKSRVKKLEDVGHDPSDWKSACERAMEWGDTLYTGLFFRAERPSLDALEPVIQKGPALARRPLGLSDEQVKSLKARLM